MSHTTNGSDHLQEPALRYARQDFPIIRDSAKDWTTCGLNKLRT
jgi:hypothetical protein